MASRPSKPERLIEVASGDEPVAFEGRPRQHGGVCVFAYADPLGRLVPAQQYHLEQVAEAGLDLCVVAAGKLQSSAIDFLRTIAWKVVVRPNVGRDFSSYACGIQLLKKESDVDHILLLNDSVYGPFFPLRPIIDEGLSTDCDLFGLTDSWDKAYHLQGYFVLLKRACVDNKIIREFWNSLTPLYQRQAVIDEYEIGLSVRATVAGLVLAARHNVRKAMHTALSSDDEISFMKKTHQDFFSSLGPQLGVNQTHFFWRILMEKYGFPYLKRELLLENPSDVVDVWMWPHIVATTTNYPVNLIDDDLKQRMAFRYINNGAFRSGP